MTSPRVVLSRSGVGRLRTGHPWIYPDHVAAAEGTAPAPSATLVRLEGPAGVPRGAALHHPHSKLPVRVVSHEPAFPLDEDFWRPRLDRAVAARRGLAAPPPRVEPAGDDAATRAPGRAPVPEATLRDDAAAVGLPEGTAGDEACRWVHAEADGLPGLIVDRYGDVAVVQAGCLWADRLVPALAEHLMARHGITGVLARHDRAFRRPEGLAEGVAVVAGEVPDTVTVRLGGLPRAVDPRRGQKTGAYLDQRENHVWAARVLPAGRVLDAFCGDGGFTLPLARAGATVDALDGSGPALTRLEASAARLGLDGAVRTHRVNVFDDLRERAARGDRLDAMVLDPPALAKRKGQLPAARRGYKELNLRALRLLRPGGRLVSCSCSAQIGPAELMAILASAAADARRRVVVREVRGAALCHPHLVTFPESAYLVVVLLEVDDRP